jgi:hypothetical protein
MVKVTYPKKAYKKRRTYKKKKYAPKKQTMFKVPKRSIHHFKRERWLDIDFQAPGGAAWSADGRTASSVTDENPLLNFRMNIIAENGDPQYSRVTWQPIFKFNLLPDLSDLLGLFRQYKIHKIAITLYPMRATNPTQTAGATPQTNPIASNVICTTWFAKTGIDSRIEMGTDQLSQVERKKTKLYNLGIGNEKLGWYFTPSIQDITFKDQASQVVPVVDGNVDLKDAFAHTIRKPGWMDINNAASAEMFGPLISFRSVDGSSLARGTFAGSNARFRACVKYYFSCKGVH